MFLCCKCALKIHMKHTDAHNSHHWHLDIIDSEKTKKKKKKKRKSSQGAGERTSNMSHASTWTEEAQEVEEYEHCWQEDHKLQLKQLAIKSAIVSTRIPVEGWLIWKWVDFLKGFLLSEYLIMVIGCARVHNALDSKLIRPRVCLWLWRQRQMAVVL